MPRGLSRHFLLKLPWFEGIKIELVSHPSGW